MVTHAVQTGNKIGFSGACGLGEGLKSNRGLKVLGLVSWCLYLCLLLRPYLVCVLIDELVW
jgi:hypothetical protein